MHPQQAAMHGWGVLAVLCFVMQQHHSLFLPSPLVLRCAAEEFKNPCPWHLSTGCSAHRGGPSMVTEQGIAPTITFSNNSGSRCRREACVCTWCMAELRSRLRAHLGSDMSSTDASKDPLLASSTHSGPVLFHSVLVRNVEHATDPATAAS
jgi:hypothetical protein